MLFFFLYNLWVSSLQHVNTAWQAWTECRLLKYALTLLAAHQSWQFTVIGLCLRGEATDWFRQWLIAWYTDTESSCCTCALYDNFWCLGVTNWFLIFFQICFPFFSFFVLGWGFFLGVGAFFLFSLFFFYFLFFLPILGILCVAHLSILILSLCFVFITHPVPFVFHGICDS